MACATPRAGFLAARGDVLRVSSLHIADSHCIDRNGHRARKHSTLHVSPTMEAQTTKCQSSLTAATLPFGVFARGDGFFSSVKSGGKSRYLGSFNSALDAQNAVRSHLEATNALPTARIPYSGV